jgi:hypothetical protein
MSERVTPKMAERIVRTYSDIVSILKDGGHKVRTNTCKIHVSGGGSVECQSVSEVDGHMVFLSFDARRSNWSNYPNGQLQGHLGGYPSTTLPEPKTGFDCVKIAQTILDDIDRDVKKAQRNHEIEVRRHTAEDFRSQVADKINTIVAEHHLPYIEVRSSSTEGHVGVTFNKVTEAEAVSLANHLASLRTP